MSFLNPIALWGLLAISIPILIHLWNGKRGKTIAWAAMTFLQDEESRVSKGIQLENLLVLILRIILIGILVLILSQAFWDLDETAKKPRVAHLLYGDQNLWEEFRFEIQQALGQDETVLVSGNGGKPIESLESLFSQNLESKENLQVSLDKLPEELDSLIIYFPNSNAALESYFYITAVSPSFVISKQDPVFMTQNSIQTSSELVYQVNDLGVLEMQSNQDTGNAKFDYSRKAIGYFIQNSTEERIMIEAALSSISEVYGFNLQATQTLDSAALVFSNQEIGSNEDSQLHFITDSKDFSDSKNSILFPENWTTDDSELIRNGRLPELILESYLEFIGLERKVTSIDSTLLEKRFLVKPKSTSQKANLNGWLLMFLFGTLLLERLLSLKQKI